MSFTKTTMRELEEAIRKEVAHWPGVTVEFGGGKAKYEHGGLVFSRAISDVLGVEAMLADHRRVIEQIGATRDGEPEPHKPAVPLPDPPKDDPAAKIAEQIVEAAAPALAPEASVTTADRLLEQLRERGFDLNLVGEISRAELIGTAATMIRDGIYFGLPMEVYREVPRLGAGDLCKLNQSPGDFWAGSWMDPDRKEADEEEKAWQIVGSAYHCARLEPDEFGNRYARKPCKADFAEQAAEHGACWNGTEIGNALADLGETKKRSGESVGEQARRLFDCGYEGVIWPMIEAEFEAQHGTQIALEAKVWDQIQRDMERLRGSKEIAGKFTDAGASEVSVFWTDENNIQRKARFDRLEPDYWLDFKTFDNSRGKRLEQAINDAIRYNRYYVTAASYREAYLAIRQLQIESTASEAEAHLIARIQISPKDPRMWFVFQQKSGVPNLLAREFVFHDVPDAIENSWDTGADDEAVARGHAATERPTLIYAKGRTEVDYAKRLFAMYSQVYAPGEPWAPLEPVGRISDLDFNSNWLEGRYD